MSDRFLAATRKGLFTFERGAGAAWKIARVDFVAENVTLALADPRDGTLYAALDHGHYGVKLHRSLDGGKNWEECAVPEYPEKPEGYSEINPMSQKEIPWSLKLIWELTPGGADQDGLIWAGTIPGGLFVSKDRGTSWELIRPLWDHPSRKEWFGGGMDWAGIHSVVVDPRDSLHVLAAVSCGGVWRTRDLGESWEVCSRGMIADYMPPDQVDDPNVQDPHRMVQCLTNPDHLWVQHHGGIFRSTDGSESWQMIEGVQPSHFGFAVAVHPEDSDTAWFVPAQKDEHRVPVDGRVVVTRTRDGGESFDVLTQGLPQEHAYDLVFRHSLDVDASGECLAFGSTTGNLWVSENSGDSWTDVARHLPPVYCVRFA